MSRRLRPPAPAEDAGLSRAVRISICVGWVLVTLLFGGCGPRRFSLPSDPGIPLSDYQEQFNKATEPCRGVETIELMLAIDGQTGGERVRGRARGALARPSSIRLEGLAPFGAPGFVLVSAADTAVLMLPRDGRVVRQATASDLLEVLAGVALAPADFQAVLTGCLVSGPRPRSARSYANGWVGFELEGDAILYTKPVDGVPVVVAGRRGRLIVEYLDHVRGLPRQLRLQVRRSDSVTTTLTAVLSQVSINIEINPAAVVPQVPVSFVPMTLDELRRVGGPLEDRSQRPPPGQAGEP